MSRKTKRNEKKSKNRVADVASHAMVMPPPRNTASEIPTSSNDTDSVAPKKRRRFRWGDVLAVVALVVSIASAGISFWTAQEQQEQWQTTALGTVVVEDIGFVAWRAYSQDEIDATDFGYEPDFEVRGEGRSFDNRFFMVSRLVLRRTDADRDEGSEFWGWTTEDLSANIKQKKVDTSNGWRSAKEYCLTAKLRKLGSTPAKDFSADLQFKDFETGEWVRGNTIVQKSDLFPDERHVLTMYFRRAIEAEALSTLHVNINIRYIDVDGSQKDLDIPFELNRTLAMPRQPLER